MSTLLQSLQQSGPLAISILLLLLICSVSVWTILISKILVWKKYRSSNKDVLRNFEEVNNLFQFIEQTKQCSEGPVQRFVIDASQEIDQLKPLTHSKIEYRSELIELLDRSFEAMVVHEELKLRTGQSTLATISVTAPFVGLLGTVLGVIDTFQGISQLQSVELTVVGPGISEALVATGAGLFAAIPAVVAYNLFNAYIRDSIEQIESLSLKFLQRLHLQFLLTNEKKATRKDLSPTVREFALICLMVYQYLPKLGGSLNSDHFKRMEHAKKLLTRIHDERGVSTLQQQLHNAIEYVKTKPIQAPDRGRKSREEREAAEAVPTFFKGDVPEERDFKSNKDEKEVQSNIFSRNLPKDKEF